VACRPVDGKLAEPLTGNCFEGVRRLCLLDLLLCAGVYSKGEEAPGLIAQVARLPKGDLGVGSQGELLLALPGLGTLGARAWCRWA